MVDMKFSDGWYHFLVAWTNSWAFRTVALGFLLLLGLTLLYSALETKRFWWKSARLERLCSRIFIGWGLVLEALVAFVAVLYMLNIRIIWG